MGVSEFTQRLKTLLELHFPVVRVRGEISNLRHQSSGHVYFTLKDAGSQLPAVFFRAYAARSQCALRDGLQVIATGTVDVYAPRGAYQLMVREVEELGAGRLQAAFEVLRQRLAAEGLFDKAAKRTVPLLPRVIGLVTSPTGAALQDFLRILRRRNWCGRVVVLPVRVQGREAAGEIATQLRNASTVAPFDLLVLMRGGGSLEDLWPFNEEVLVRAIRATNTPVISAVGHEIDFTLSDFAADLRAETPSGAAELISSGRVRVLERLERAISALELRSAHARELHSRRVAMLGALLARHSPERWIEQSWLRLDDLRNRLQAPPRLALGESRARLNAACQRMESTAARQRERAAVRIAELGRRIRMAGVGATLARGFILARDNNGQLVRSAAEVTPNAEIQLQFADGVASVIGK